MTNKIELKDDELEQVIGGNTISYNNVEYSENDMFGHPEQYYATPNDPRWLYIIKNLTSNTLDIYRYMYFPADQSARNCEVISGMTYEDFQKQGLVKLTYTVSVFM